MSNHEYYHDAELACQKEALLKLNSDTLRTYTTFDSTASWPNWEEPEGRSEPDEEEDCHVRLFELESQNNEWSTSSPGTRSGLYIQEIREALEVVKQENESSNSHSPTGSIRNVVNFDNETVNNTNNPKSNSACPKRAREVMRKMRFLTAVAAMGGFLSGYNTGVISGAMLPVQRRFALSISQQELIVSSTICSAFIASLWGGTLVHCLGRRHTLLGAAAVFCLGAIVLSCSTNVAMLVTGEILLGIGVGIESLTSPMYIAEMAKPSIRGTLVSMYALMMCFGQVFAGLIDGTFSRIDGGWRFMFGFAALPAVCMLLGFKSLPESPAFLASKNRHVEAIKVLATLRDSDYQVQTEFDELLFSLRFNSSNTSSSSSSSLQRLMDLLTDAPSRRALTVGCGLMLLQQVCGPNAVLYYAASIYQMAQYSESTSIWLAAFTAAAQIVGLAVSVALVERVGRRILVLGSLTLTALASMGLAASFYLARISSTAVDLALSDPQCRQQPSLVWDGLSRHCFDCVQIPGCGFCAGACVAGSVLGPFDNSNTCSVNANPNSNEWIYNGACGNSYGWMSVVFMVLFLAFFGAGMGGLPWTYNSEIYTLQHRSLAVSISTATNWIANLLVSSSFLTISSPALLYSYGSFALYAILSLVGVVWLYVVMPETKGLTLEQVQARFRKSTDKIVL